MAAAVNNNAQRKADYHRRLLSTARLHSTTVTDDDSPVNLSSETSITIPIYSDNSLITSTVLAKTLPSRSYRYAQLERALVDGKILKTYDDRMKFEDEYLIAIQEDTFDKFAEKYYKKIDDRNDAIEREKEKKKTRRFTFLDFEDKLMAVYPTRGIEIKFQGEPDPWTIAQLTKMRSASAHQRSAPSGISNNELVDSFYANCSQRFLANPERAQKEITSFAHRTAQNLHELLPKMTTIPQRVKVIDKRDPDNKPHEYILSEMNHKRAISLITKRRHLMIKMMVQAKKNQMKMRQWKRTPIAVDNSTCYREILERTNDTEEVHREKSIERPQTAVIPRRISRKNISLSASVNVPSMNIDTTPEISSCLTSFQDSLTLDQVENTKNTRVLFSTRPLTAPTKVKWANYC